jgi:hypothetical protein
MMKRLLTLLAWGLLVGFTYSQGNLQFNQVLKLQWNQTTPAVAGYHTVGPYVVTVPVGKVLKIESMNVSATRVALAPSYEDAAGFYSSFGPPSIFLEDVMIYSSSYGFSSAGFGPVIPQIHWLQPGNHNFYIGGYSPGPASAFTAIITAIEFNVVP